MEGWRAGKGVDFFKITVIFFFSFLIHFRNLILLNCFHSLPSADNGLSQSEHTCKPHPGQELELYQYHRNVPHSPSRHYAKQYYIFVLPVFELLESYMYSFVCDSVTQHYGCKDSSRVSVVAICSFSLSHILLHDYGTIYLSISLLRVHWSCVHLGLLGIMLLQTFLNKTFDAHMYSFLMCI